MPSRTLRIDRFFLISVSLLTLFGFVIFLSASLGLLVRDGADFTTVAVKQAVSLVIGIAVFIVISKFKYTGLRKAAFFIFLAAIGLNLLLFIPPLALEHGGASRWIDLGFITFQPSEFLKIAFIIYLAAWLQYAKDAIGTFKYGFLPFIFLTAILSALLLAQRDTDTLTVICATGLVMLIVGGLKIRHAILAGLAILLVVGSVAMIHPYARQRVKTFMNREADAQGAGYQINQSLIAIGSGQATGRGFGQSVQKFGYLPEPIGDSIFAVAAEEFGFLGSVMLVIMYIIFGVSAFRVGTRAPDIFGGMLAIGIAVLVLIESFLNMSAMLGLVPLSGMPLLFVSHGGTALIIALLAAGIVANVSKYGRERATA